MDAAARTKPARGAVRDRPRTAAVVANARASIAYELEAFDRR